MFKKLRIKFIAIIMVSVAVVLAVVFTAICMSEYQRSVSSVNTALEAAINDAAMGEGPAEFAFEGITPDERTPEDGDQVRPESDMNRPPRESTQSGSTSYGGFRIGGAEEGRRNMVPVAVYRLEDDGTYSAVSGIATASISDEVLEEAVTTLATAREDSGTIDELALHYQRRTVEDATFVAFADTSNTSGWQSLALRLGIAGFAVLAVFFVISLFFSKWALRPVKEAWDSQKQFIADASHELKTPLTVILANTSILLKHPEKTIANQSQWIESTQAEATGMHQLVNEMLELAQVEEQAHIEHEQLDLSDLVDGVTLQFESVAFERGCSFDCEIAEGITVIGDETHLKKMVSTLVENALKYVDDKGTVEVNLASSAGNAKLSIRNTGSVISAEDLPHIFDRFYRTDKARTSGAGGFGLGLAIARGTAQEHGGDITCTSSADAGTTFTVVIPEAR